ncbi:probable dolichyl pyrophosphate Glc1Man9GlcNAc2 alpha-1,3-glucosyltransferase [Leptopilina boulardi]|uniref:probable dolichyl pyrophosphate Glc1Man9GlcNAc2 alpha-1,3-glucosyltransferase n=1 Tax=Leptopilina boulardi TaxID=63433 RepID=UPI0021F63D29|nr:probable dolichyl pyrophosphate Glc1Man9GlcNAc2 alpha-1,3-glucosyltransferase [Leptopilina boulardi]
MDFINSNVEDRQRIISHKKCDVSKITMNGILIRIFCLISCIKLLLIPTYHSTDFEVHRNWLAITHSLPVNEWYKTEISQWTLDYPPFFAWFEYFLSLFAVFFDVEMLKLENLNYASFNTKVFQRSTVIITDIVFLYGVKKVGDTCINSTQNFIIFIILSLTNIGLWIIDHIHFQYNGFLLGILLISIAGTYDILKKKNILEGAAWFSILLNLKHIYVYVAPAYVVWLLKWCLKRQYFIRRFLQLAIIVLTTLLISFWPFKSQLPQVFSRLFPFKRGLLHAYWAANFWALYAGFDKLLVVLWKNLGWHVEENSARLTGGLVQEQSFLLLPTPSPIATFSITILFMMPSLLKLAFKDELTGGISFIRCLVICGLSSFMFSYHVHEKAILTSIIALSVLSVINKNDARVFIILCLTGITALFPLLYPKDLLLLKILLFTFYAVCTIALLIQRFKKNILLIYEWIYIANLPLLIIYESILHQLLFGEKLPFLPLAITSLYCSIGVTYSFCLYYFMYHFGYNK